MREKEENRINQKYGENRQNGKFLRNNRRKNRIKRNVRKIKCGCKKMEENMLT